MWVAKSDFPKRLAYSSLKDKVQQAAQTAQSHCFGRSDERDSKPGKKTQCRKGNSRGGWARD